MMAEGDGLGHLQVREPRHDGVGVLLGQINQGALQIGQQAMQQVNLLAQPQADIGRHLVVAGARGVQPLARIAHQFGQPFLDVQVHVFEVELPCKAPLLDVLADDRHAPADIGQILIGE